MASVTSGATLAGDAVRRRAGWAAAAGCWLHDNAAILPAVAILLVAAIGPFVTPYSPFDFVGAPFDPPSPDNRLGCDLLGRDVLSRVLAGGWRILLLSGLATVLGTMIGAVLGVVGAYARGILDDVIMRVCDVGLAFPQIILALLFISMLGPRPWLIVLVVAVTHVPQVARTLRASALRIVEEDFIRYAELIGVRPMTVVLREIMPNLAAPLRVELGLRLTFSVALIAGISFLGLSDDPSQPDWGLMINENRIGLDSNPMPVVVPILIIAVLTVSLNLWSDRQAHGRPRRRSVPERQPPLA